MTYVSDMNSVELAAHMKRLQAMPGWHDPAMDRVWQEVETMRQRAESAERALAEVRAMFPIRLDKQSFVVNGSEPLRADGDDEFYSAAKVNHVLTEILERIDAALAQQVKT